MLENSEYRLRANYRRDGLRFHTLLCNMAQSKEIESDEMKRTEDVDHATNTLMLHLPTAHSVLSLPCNPLACDQTKPDLSLGRVIFNQ